jgi:hypothetical protein
MVAFHSYVSLPEGMLENWDRNMNNKLKHWPTAGFSREFHSDLTNGPEIWWNMILQL